MRSIKGLLYDECSVFRQEREPKLNHHWPYSFPLELVEAFSVINISKIKYFVIIQSGLSIGVKIMIFCSKKFLSNFYHKGGPLRKKIFFFPKKYQNLHTNRKPWLNYNKIFYFRNIYDWFPSKKIPKTDFYTTPKKAILKNRVFGLKKHEKPINAYLKSNFASIYLQN